MARELTSNENGDLLVPAERLGKLKGKDPAGLRLIHLADELILSAHTEPGQRVRPFLFGDLRFLRLAELLALITSMRKNGALSVLIPQASKTLYFQAGEIVYATSTVEDDRLGECLWRHGMISLEQLSQVHDLVKPQRRMGAVLVEAGMLTPRQLYEGIKAQVLDIVLSTFYITQGEFVFYEEKLALRNAVRLEKDTREIVREGVRRVEEMSRLEGVFSDRNRIPLGRPVMVDVKLAEADRTVFGLVDGRLSVAGLLGQSRLGELETLKSLARLRRMGLIELVEPAAGGAGDALPHTFEILAEMIKVVYQRLRVKAPATEKRLEVYVRTPAAEHKEVFQRVEFDADGHLDLETIFRNAKMVRPEGAKELALEALRGLQDYALFQAMDVLADDDCDELLNRLAELKSKLVATQE